MALRPHAKSGLPSGHDQKCSYERAGCALVLADRREGAVELHFVAMHPQGGDQALPMLSAGHGSRRLTAPPSLELSISGSGTLEG
jgi:hypothetical protein